MKNKWSLISAIVQLVIGALAVVSFFVLWASGEDMTRWIITLILSVAFVVLGVIGIIDYKSQNNAFTEHKRKRPTNFSLVFYIDYGFYNLFLGQTLIQIPQTLPLPTSWKCSFMYFEHFSASKLRSPFVVGNSP